MSFLPSSSPVQQLDAVAARRLVTDGAVLLDVREPAEWNAGHAPGAVHVPLGSLTPSSVPAGRDVVVICRSGSRSNLAAQLLTSVGVRAVNVVGGMLAWHAAGFDVRRDSGRPGEVM